MWSCFDKAYTERGFVILEKEASMLLKDHMFQRADAAMVNVGTGTSPRLSSTKVRQEGPVYLWSGEAVLWSFRGWCEGKGFWGMKEIPGSDSKLRGIRNFTRKTAELVL